MKVAWLAVLLAVPMLAGCLDFLDDDGDDFGDVRPADVGYDPQDVTVTGVQTHELTITSGDAELDTLVYVPQTTDSIDGEAVQWPVVILLHGWGFPREMYTNMPLSNSEAPTAMLPSNDLMQTFAEGGLLTVAYDARGWYRSTGTTTVSGLAELNDLRTVIDTIQEQFPASDRVGVAGVSLGGGLALKAWERLDEVVTVVPHNGWVDLYEGLAPGNVLKLEWAAMLSAFAVPGTKAVGTSQELAGWAAALISRQDADAVDDVRADMDGRSILDAAATTDKPIFLCQGLQETLFPQAHLVWQNAPGFARAQYYTGGHVTLDEDCWHKTKLWFQFFLGGHDTGADEWPAVRTVDHGDDAITDYSDQRIREIEHRDYFLHSDQMVEAPAPNATWNVQQQVAANPVHEPQGIWDTTGGAFEALPAPLRQDPTATFFASAPMDQSEALLGAPTVTLHLDADTVPFQAVATLYHSDGSNWRMLGRSATSPLSTDHLQNGTVTIDLPWIKADLGAGDQLVLKIGANDETAFFPLLANYDVAFTGESTVSLPFFAPTGSSQ